MYVCHRKSRVTNFSYLWSETNKQIKTGYLRELFNIPLYYTYRCRQVIVIFFILQHCLITKIAQLIYNSSSLMKASLLYLKLCDYDTIVEVQVFAGLQMLDCLNKNNKILQDILT